MAPQEKVSVLCEVLFGRFSRAVASAAFDGRTPTAGAFVADPCVAWAVVLNAGRPRLLRGF